MESTFTKYGFKKADRYGVNCFDKKDTKIGHVVIVEKRYKFNVLFMDIKNPELKNDLFGCLDRNNTIEPKANESKEDALNEFLNNLLYLENPELAKEMYNL